MIFEIIMYVITIVLKFLGQFLPGYGTVPLQLPWGTDAWISQGITGYEILAQSFPPMGVVMTAFLIYIGFKIAVQLLKMIPIIGRSLR